MNLLKKKSKQWKVNQQLKEPEVAGEDKEDKEDEENKDEE